MKHIKVTSKVKPFMAASGACDDCMSKMARLNSIFGIPTYDKALQKCNVKTGGACT
ncbi:MAG: hypothetical protein JXR94_08880 [Candidatus Hydrogenedentes bacterium]|nr:hypothetical protein [Candidatus Hydrogenedentota bacterium]